MANLSGSVSDLCSVAMSSAFRHADNKSVRFCYTKFNLCSIGGVVPRTFARERATDG